MNRSDIFRLHIPSQLRQWLSKVGMIELWNLHEHAAGIADFHLWARTNCALERYNREFNEKFSRRHPGLTTFAACLSDAADEIVEKLENVMSGKFQPPTYGDIPFPSIPQEYEHWVAPNVFFCLTDHRDESASPSHSVVVPSVSASTEEEEEAKVSDVAEQVPVAEEAMGRGKRVRKKNPTYDV